MSFFSFPDDVRWNDDDDRVEFGVAIGDYEGLVRLPRLVLRRLLARSLSPEQCIEAYHGHRTEIERAVETKLRRRELAADGNVDLTGQDLRRELPPSA